MLTTFEFAEPYCCGSFIRGASFFSRVKDTKVVSLNGRFPFASIKRYTPIAGSIVFVKTFIQRLLSQRRRSQRVPGARSCVGKGEGALRT